MIAAWLLAALAPLLLVSPQPVVIGQSYTVRSKPLGSVRRINVLLPDGYDAPENRNRRYTTLYLLDGGDGLQDFAHIATMVQHAARWDSGTAPAIVVGIESRDRRAEFTTPSSDPAERRDFPTSGKAETFRAFLVREGKPAIDAKFRTSGDDVIMGESLAGLFVVDVALRHPGDFDRHIAISPSLWWDRQNLSRTAARWLGRRARSDDALWLAIGNEGGTMQEGMDRLLAALRSTGEGKMDWTYRPMHTEGHGTILHPAATNAIRDVLNEAGK